MTNNDLEIEIKFKIDNPEKLNKILRSRGAKFLGRAFQRTIRFDTPNLDYEKTGTFVRVRSGHGNTVTLKRRTKNNEDFFERQEIETEVKDIEKMRQIIKGLGLSVEFIMEKYRSNWGYNNTNISIDELPFGTYIEIEGKEGDILETANKLGLNLSKSISVSYWDLFAEHKKHNGLEGSNIVFAKK